VNGSARDIAVSALLLWEREQTYSNIMLDNLLKESGLVGAEAAFATRLVYGVLERLLTIDWLLSKNSRQPLKKWHPTVRAILRTAVYQLAFTEKIPSSAAVNEAVKQVKRSKAAYAAGFVNGVLHAVDREKDRLLASLPHDLKGESLRYSVPLELLTAFRKAYGAEHAVALASAANEAPPVILRVNTLKGSTAVLTERAEQAGVSCQTVNGLADALCVGDFNAFRKAISDDSLYYLQDAASQWAVQLLDPCKGDRILDVCAAPGGKSFTAAMHMEDTGDIVSCDLYDRKAETVRERAKAFGIRRLRAVCRDASSPLPADWTGAFDRVICDVPCSGFGVIRRRPEIRYKALSSFDELPCLQYTILCEAAKAVKAGGVLQYSTCTLRPEENEQVVARFLSEHPQFEEAALTVPTLDNKTPFMSAHGITLMPHIHGTDGFYVAKLHRKELV